jgi:hypothetical protein
MKKKKKELNKADCPEFDYFNYEPILKWAGAKVVWDDTFVHAGTGKRTKRPEHALWTLLWQHGFIGFDCISLKKDKKKARMAGAMFIYLWCKGVSASIADNCASLYARNVIMYRG